MKDTKIINKDDLVIYYMRKYGDNFIQTLALCFSTADRKNFNILRNAFYEYWDKYEKMAFKNKETK